MRSVVSVNPRTGAETEFRPPTTPAELDAITAAADAAAGELLGRGREWRAALLREMAARLEADGERIVGLADAETAIGTARLTGELTRTLYQLRLFADAVEEGSFLEATIDHATDTPMGPAPDLRRMLLPLGPVAVFGASNFPLAFSVPGGDTASALAAGCPVVVKAHSSHPATSQAAFEALAAGARAMDAPEGLIGLVFGTESGAALVADARIKAVGFTGSLEGGRALMDIIARRPDPIPFYGELSSLNPVVVTPLAAQGRGAEIAQGLVGSFTVGAGQLCTKPGLVFIPEGEAGDRLVAAIGAAVADGEGHTLLNRRIHESFGQIIDELTAVPAATVVARSERTAPPGFGVLPVVVEVPSHALDDRIVRECFGPATVVARYRDDAALFAAVRDLPGSLTATIHSDPAESALATALTGVLRDKAGRVIYDGYPTGVSVAWAQTHGGPWPSTSSVHTSVGMTAARRFLRPMTWQNAPEAVLPLELRDDYESIPRRVDGVLIGRPVGNADRG